MKVDDPAYSFLDSNYCKPRDLKNPIQESVKNGLGDWDYLIGYIDHLGIFRWDVDPQGKNGYIKEEIETDRRLLPIIFRKDEITEWRKQISVAWEILKGVYKSLRWYRMGEGNKVFLVD